MLQPFESVRERLLRAGIAPRHASRYVTELREHLADLTERERAAGLDVRQAADRAMAFVGSEADLAQAMIDRGPPRSLTARAPWAVFIVLPLVVLVVMLGITLLPMMRLLWSERALTPSQLPESYRVIIEIVSFVSNYLVGALLAGGCLAVALRQRMNSGWALIGLCIIAVLFSGLLGFHMNVIAPQGSHPAFMTYSAIGLVFVQGRVSAVATIAVAALHAAILFIIAVTAYLGLKSRLPQAHA